MMPLFSRLGLACLLFGCAAWPSPAFAELSNEMAKCAVIAGDLARLECFDGVAATSGLNGPQPQPVQTDGVGQWSVSRTVNPIDDTETVILRLTATSGEARWGNPVTFVARCRSNSTEAYVIWGDYLGNDSDTFSSEFKEVIVRIGNQPAQTQRWGISTDKEATFAPSGAVDFLIKMAGSSSLVVQTTPYNENPTTAIFDTAGMSAALAPLADVCSWSPAQKQAIGTGIPVEDRGAVCSSLGIPKGSPAMAECISNPSYRR
jgi:type VI secretion system protein VasI